MGKPQEDTIGLPGMPVGLCSLGRRYSLEILGELGIKKSLTFLLIALCIRIHLHDNFFDYGGIRGGGVFFKFLVVIFVTKLLFCFFDVIKPFNTTTADPLSAGLMTMSCICQRVFSALRLRGERLLLILFVLRCCSCQSVSLLTPFM